MSYYVVATGEAVLFRCMTFFFRWGWVYSADVYMKGWSVTQLRTITVETLADDGCRRTQARMFGKFLRGKGGWPRANAVGGSTRLYNAF